MPIVAPNEPHCCRITRSWSSGYDRRLPSDGPGFNSRRTQFFFHRAVSAQPGWLVITLDGTMFLFATRSNSQLTAKPNSVLTCLVTRLDRQFDVHALRWTDHTPAKKKRNPRNRSRTSDLEISIVAIYSLPLCQLSYTRTYGSTAADSEK